MVKTLRDHFPIIRDWEEVLADIYSKEELLEWYESWEEEQQKLFLEYCTGMRGVRGLTSFGVIGENARRCVLRALFLNKMTKLSHNISRNGKDLVNFTLVRYNMSVNYTRK